MSYPELEESILIKAGRIYSFNKEAERLNQVGSDGWEQISFKNFHIGATDSINREDNLFPDGDCVFLNTASGNDANSGLTRLLPKLTYPSAATAASGAGRKAIVLLNGGATLTIFAGTASDEITIPLIQDKGTAPSTITKTSGNNGDIYTETTVSPPTARRGVAAIRNNSDLILLYGGETAASTFQSTFLSYNPVTKTFATISPATSPGVRGWARFARHTTIGSFLLFGGQTGAGTYSNTLYLWNGTDFSLQSTTGDTPAARGKFGFLEYCGKVYLYGGVGASNYSDFYEYDPSTLKWTLLSETTMPDVVGDSSLVLHNGLMYLFGNNGSNNFKCWVYSFTTGWKDVTPTTQTATTFPQISGQVYSGCVPVSIGSYIHFYAGYNNTTMNGYVWYAQATGTEKLSFVRRALVGSASPVANYFPVEYGGEAYLFFGETNSTPTRTNQVAWVYREKLKLKYHATAALGGLQGFKIKLPVIANDTSSLLQLYDCDIQTEYTLSGVDYSNDISARHKIELKRCKILNALVKTNQITLRNCSLILCQTGESVAPDGIPALHIFYDGFGMNGTDTGIQNSFIKSFWKTRETSVPLVYMANQVSSKESILVQDGDNPTSTQKKSCQSYSIIIGAASGTSASYYFKRITLTDGLLLGSKSIRPEYCIIDFCYQSSKYEGGEFDFVAAIKSLSIYNTWLNDISQIMTASPLFYDRNTYKLKAIANGDGVDSPCLTLGASVSGETQGSGAVSQDPTEIGAYINHYSAMVQTWERVRRMVRPNTIRQFYPKIAKENIGLDGTVDVYSKPEKRTESIILEWQYPLHEPEDVEFFEYLESLEDTVCEIYLFPNQELFGTFTTDGAATPINTWQIELDGNDVVPIGSKFDFGGRTYDVIGVYPASEETERILVTPVLESEIPSSETISLFDITGAGTYSYVPENRESELFYSQKDDLKGGFRMVFSRKKQ
jgi:hypothetical protein